VGDVVHYCHDTEKEECLCGAIMTNFFEMWDYSTRDKAKVTCHDCLKKLGRAEVDHEKVEFAKAIVNNWEHDAGGGSYYCAFCKMWLSDDDHHGDCIVIEAEAYLKSVKGESSEPA